MCAQCATAACSRSALVSAVLLVSFGLALLPPRGAAAGQQGVPPLLRGCNCSLERLHYASAGPLPSCAPTGAAPLPLAASACDCGTCALLLGAAGAPLTAGGAAAGACECSLCAALTRAALAAALRVPLSPADDAALFAALGLDGGAAAMARLAVALGAPAAPPLPSAPAPQPPPPRRGLMLVIGGHGRVGAQGTPVSGAGAGFFEQRLASLSHVALLEHLAARDRVVCDVALLSYQSAYQAEVCAWYARGPGALLSCEFLSAPIGIDALALAAAEATVLNASTAAAFAAYDFALVMRVDLILKRHFFAAIDTRTDRITFSHAAQIDIGIAAAGGGGAHDWGRPQLAISVGGPTALVPRDLWPAYFEQPPMWHDAWLLLEERGVPRQRLGFMIPTLHDADSGKDWVPMYRIAGRSEECAWQSPGWSFNASAYDATGNASASWVRDDPRWAGKESFWDTLGIDDTCPVAWPSWLAPARASAKPPPL